MRTGRRGRDLETAGLLRAGIHDQTRPLTTTIGRPLRRQTVGEVTLMAAVATRAGTARISRLRGRVGRREVITRMLPRITAVGVAAAGPMRRRRVLTRHRAVVLPRRRGRIQHRPLRLARTQHRPRRRGRIQHHPLLLARTPLLAVVTAAAEVGVAEAVAAADRSVAVAAPRTGVEVTPEVAEDRTATK
jgi:hypothetical protein